MFSALLGGRAVHLRKGVVALCTFVEVTGYFSFDLGDRFSFEWRRNLVTDASNVLLTAILEPTAARNVNCVPDLALQFDALPTRRR
ncbi:hypothetical protein [Haladaptatus sp. DFWS20]|uniref:hypothetical protein n=1 Tax=Haladaptatus sp. DFWS20 TaxID=3403467 RepID=UPI003EBE1363